MSPPGHLLDTVRSALLNLPRAAETMQWGSKLVFWTMDKSVGGKMFAIVDLEVVERPAICFAAGPHRSPLLLEQDGIGPAPYLARAHWVACDDWQVLPLPLLLEELRAAYLYVAGRMPTRVQRLYDLSAREYRALVRNTRDAQKSKKLSR